jgi:hypothetical protein
MDTLGLILLNVVCFTVIGAFYLAFTSVYVIPPDKMLVSILFGTYRCTYVSGTYARNVPTLPAGIIRGLFGLDLVILLWPIWRGIYFPTTTVVLRYHAARIYTKDGIPVNMDATIVFQLGPPLADFIETFNVFGHGDDLAREEDIEYLVDRKPDTGEVMSKSYRNPCLAQVILNSTDNLVLETLRRVASSRKWEEIRKDIPLFERDVKYELAAPESAFIASGMLERRLDDTLNAYPGPSVRADRIDVVFEDVTPINQDFFDSLSAPATGKNRGIGEGNRIKETAKLAKISGKELVRNETARQADELNIIAAGDTLTAVVGGLIAGRGTPKTGTSGRPASPS